MKILTGVFILILASTFLYASNLHQVEQKATHYDVNLKIDIEQEAIDVTCRVDYLHEKTSTNSLQFFLNKNLQIKKISAQHLKDYTIEVSSISEEVHAITLQFKQTLEPGDRIPIKFAYAGALRQEDMPYDVDKISADWLELSLNSFWHPIIQGFETYFTADILLDLPGQFEVVSSGKVSRKGKRFFIQNTVPQVDIVFCASPKFLQRQAGKLTLYYIDPAQPFLDELIQYGSESLDFLNDWLGKINTLPNGKIVITPRPETGYARKHFIILSNLKNSNAEHLSNFIAHEFAHFWWTKGDSHTSANWLNESFAEYTALQYQRDYLGEEVFQKAIENLKKRSENLPPIIQDKNNERQPHGVLYHKGPLKLYELELLIGKEAMRGLLVAINDANVSTTEALMKLIESELGENLATRFAAMLRE